MLKYATLLKSDPAVFAKILFEICKEDVEAEMLSSEKFENFVKNETARFPEPPAPPSAPLSADQFIEFLTSSRFKLPEYQSCLAITSESDVPFEAISKELLDCDFNDLQAGKEYYLLSNAWYSRWYSCHELGPSTTRRDTPSTADTPSPPSCWRRGAVWGSAGGRGTVCISQPPGSISLDTCEALTRATR